MLCSMQASKQHLVDILFFTGRKIVFLCKFGRAKLASKSVFFIDTSKTFNFILNKKDGALPRAHA